jgi:hypothetical protein
VGVSDLGGQKLAARLVGVQEPCISVETKGGTPPSPPPPRCKEGGRVPRLESEVEVPVAKQEEEEGARRHRRCSKERWAKCLLPCCCGRSGAQWTIWVISGPLTSIPGFVIGGFFFNDCPAIPELTYFLLAFAGWKAIIETMKLLCNVKPPIEKFCRKEQADNRDAGGRSVAGAGAGERWNGAAMAAAESEPGGGGDSKLGSLEIAGNALTFGLFVFSIWGLTLTLGELDRLSRQGGEGCAAAVFIMGFLSSFIPCLILALGVLIGATVLTVKVCRKKCRARKKVAIAP